MDNILSLRNQILFNVLRSGDGKMSFTTSSNKRALRNLNPDEVPIVYQKVKKDFDSHKRIWTTNVPDLTNLHSLLSKYSNNIHPSVSRVSFIDSVGEGAVKESITDVLTTGANYRTLAERQARSKILKSNFYLEELINTMLQVFKKGISKSSTEDFFVSIAAQLLIEPKASEEYKICLSLLGLTQKGLDNILNSDPKLLYSYCMDLNDSIYSFIETYLNNNINIDNFKYALKLVSISSLSLAIRGSMKSMIGKLFEKFILGTALSLFGFHYIKDIPPYNVDEYTKLCNSGLPYFWLSSTEKNGREKDATIMYKNKLIDIDIGLIGKGNPEVPADKLSRFKAEYAFGNKTFPARTIILIADLNNGNIIKNSANKYKGDVVGIRNDPDWLFSFSKCIFDFVSPNHELINPLLQTRADHPDQYKKILIDKVKKMDFYSFL